MIARHEAPAGGDHAPLPFCQPCATWQVCVHQYVCVWDCKACSACGSRCVAIPNRTHKTPAPFPSKLLG